jgi:hypothetical protein
VPCRVGFTIISRDRPVPFDSAAFSGHPILETLDRVIALLARPRGWCKGTLHTTDGRHCLIGAIGRLGDVEGLHDAILKAVRQVTGRRYGYLVRFNDDPHTTHAEVCDVLRRTRRNIIAAAALESGGTNR